MMPQIPNHIKVLLALVLFAIPIFGRWGGYYTGQRYTAPEINEIDSQSIDFAPIDYEPFVDTPIEGSGRIVVDIAHSNNLQVNDLAPLRNRLEARGVEVVAYDGTGETTLATELSQSTGFLVLAPGMPFSNEDKQAVVDFVDDGGRLLLAADPTRPVSTGEEEPGLVDLFSALFPQSAIPVINDVANEFGVVYFDDYLYNLNENEDNYRNVMLENFGMHDIASGLEEVVFFSAHTVRSNGTPIVTSGNITETVSSVRRGETDLSVMTMAYDNRVLAVGDITFMTAPYHTVASNDQLVSNIANWLAVDSRDYTDLEDFPRLFSGPVDMVQISGSLLDPQMIAWNSSMQDMFEQAGLDLNLRARVSPGNDSLLVGTFDELDRIASFLAQQGITVTLEITETEEMDPEATDESAEASEDEADATDSEEAADAEESEEADSEATDESEETAEAEATEESEEVAGTDDESAEMDEEDFSNTVQIDSLGAISLAGTSLLIVDSTTDALSVTVLAEDIESAVTTLDRLAFNDFSSCVSADNITVCATDAGLSDDDFEPLDDEDTDADTEPGVVAEVLLIADDNRTTDGSRTSIVELSLALGDTYNVTTWSMMQDGVPEEGDLDGYDAYIIDSGDYALDEEDFGMFSVLATLDGNVMVIGTQPFLALGSEFEALDDIEVSDEAHPVNNGFDPGQVIALDPSESGVPAMVITDEYLNDSPDDSSEVGLPFLRGPGSAESGTPVVFAASSNDEIGLERVIVSTFAFYRLPEDYQTQFATNAVAWLIDGTSGDAGEEDIEEEIEEEIPDESDEEEVPEEDPADEDSE